MNSFSQLSHFVEFFSIRFASNSFLFEILGLICFFLFVLLLVQTICSDTRRAKVSFTIFTANCVLFQSDARLYKHHTKDETLQAFPITFRALCVCYCKRATIMLSLVRNCIHDNHKFCRSFPRCDNRKRSSKVLCFVSPVVLRVSCLKFTMFKSKSSVNVQKTTAELRRREWWYCPITFNEKCPPKIDFASKLMHNQ